MHKQFILIMIKNIYASQINVLPLSVHFIRLDTVNISNYYFLNLVNIYQLI